MNPEIERRLRERSKINPYVNYLGIELLKLEEGYVEARMPLTDEQKQYSGVSHGGVLAALADTMQDMQHTPLLLWKKMF